MDENAPNEYPTAKTLTGKRFQLGRIVVTANAEARLMQALGDESAYRFGLGSCLARHMNCDWGDLDGEDKTVNNEAIAQEGDLSRQGRLLSAYTLAEVKFWIITEKDRSVTTILLPEDY